MKDKPSIGPKQWTNKEIKKDISRQADSQTHRQSDNDRADGHTLSWTEVIDRQGNKERDKHTHRQSDMQTSTHIDNQTSTHIDNRTNNRSDGHTLNWTEVIDKQGNKERDKQTSTHIDN